MDIEMGPHPSSKCSDGQKLTKEDQRDRLSHFHRVREERDASPENNLPGQDTTACSADHEEEETAKNLAALNLVSTENANRGRDRDGDPSADCSQRLVENAEQKQYSGPNENFNLTDSHCSFVLSAPRQVSSSSGEVGAAVSCGTCHPKPLSSTVSDTDSRTKLSSGKDSNEEDGRREHRHGEENGNRDLSTQQLGGNNERRSRDDKARPLRSAEECRTTSVGGQRPYGPLISKEDPRSVRDSEEVSEEEDDEFHDVLILCDPNDTEHLKYFKAICKKYKWTTITKEEFPSGAFHFHQLQEEADNSLLVVCLLTSHSLNHEQSKMERHAALFSSIKEKDSQKLVSVVCEDGLQLPDFLKAITPGQLYSDYFEKQFRKAMKKKKKNIQQGWRNLPHNYLGSTSGNDKGPAQSAPERRSPSQVFRGLQGNLSPGPNAQKFFTDVRFRELCLLLDLPDPLGTPHWQRLADHLGLTSQEIDWQNGQGRCASNLLEFYFYRHLTENVEVVLNNLMEIVETNLDHIQARNILAQEIEEQRRKVFKNRTQIGPGYKTKDHREK